MNFLLRLFGKSEESSPLLGILHEHPNIAVFVLVTLVIGGFGAYAAGRAIAQEWGPLWKALAAAFGLSLFVRFLHYALFEGSLLSLHYWVIDMVILGLFAALGWRMTLVSLMVKQYRWLYERAGPLSWREKSAATKN